MSNTDWLDEVLGIGTDNTGARYWAKSDRTPDEVKALVQQHEQQATIKARIHELDKILPKTLEYKISLEQSNKVCERLDELEEALALTMEQRI